MVKGRRHKKDRPSEPRSAAPPNPRALPPWDAGVVLFAVTMLLSAVLLFGLQPMFAKMVLPRLGGAPAIWNACLVFYQAILLGGYLYAHYSLKWLGPSRQAVLHLVLLCLPWIVLPIGVRDGWLDRAGGLIPSAQTFPTVWLWLLLSVSVGVPFLAVSATAPMLQAWFSRTRSPAAGDPYFLYAASNLGSLVALLGYPLVIESHLSLAAQSWTWSGGYGGLMLLIAGCALWLWRRPMVAAPPEQPTAQMQGPSPISVAPTGRDRLRWLALALVPSSLLLSVTTHISTDIVPMPSLWVIPLAIYLLTFVLAFMRRPILPLNWMVRAQPYLVVAAVGALAYTPRQPLENVFLGILHLGAFFVTAMVCHGRLAAERPAGQYLTGFYLWIALGGVLGGLLCTLVAPLVFSSVLEYPLALAAACMLRPAVPSPRAWAAVRRGLLPGAMLLACAAAAWAMSPGGLLAGWRYADTLTAWLGVMLIAAVAAFLPRRHPVAFGLALAGLAAVSLACVDREGRVLHARRTFFGVLRVTHDPVWNMNQLMHGSTSHGCQGLDARDRPQPWSYYHRKGPLGEVFQSLQARRPLRRIGALGLGTGAVAAYVQPGERITFFEIDPTVAAIAEDPAYFTYLADCRASGAACDIVLGDARLSLERADAGPFDLLVVDVFSGDTVPVHLLTREALGVYLNSLADRGLLAVHISNRYLDLKPVLGNLAAEAGLVARVRNDPAALNAVGKLPSVWVVMARREEDLAPLASDPAWKLLPATSAHVWTDDFSNVLGAMKWGFSWSRLETSAWWGSPEADAHVSLATCLLAEGQGDEARRHLEKALEIQPEHADAHCGLGNLLAGHGKIKEAIEHYWQALRSNPNSAGAHAALGEALAAQGNLKEARAHYEQALDIKPGVAPTHFALGDLLFRQGQAAGAVAQWREAARLDPRNPIIVGQLAWALAVSRDSKLRDGKEAVELAEQADALTGHADPRFLDILAAAYAEAGRFPEAVRTAQKALQLAASFKDQPLAAGMRKRLRQYQARQPYREGR